MAAAAARADGRGLPLTFGAIFISAFRKSEYASSFLRDARRFGLRISAWNTRLISARETECPPCCFPNISQSPQSFTNWLILRCSGWGCHAECRT